MSLERNMEVDNMDQLDKEYNESLHLCENNHRALNGIVMNHTFNKCQFDPKLKEAIEQTKEGMYMVLDSEELIVVKGGPAKNIVVSQKRTFEAAKAYKGKKVAVLNFANNHHIGGAPYSAGAQEESLCRTSTLYKSLLAFKVVFYEYHTYLYDEGVINHMGNDDLIYMPGVTVFKTDESAPKMMEEKDWYKVDVITSAAPELHSYPDNIDEYKKIILSRLTKVFQVAKKEGVDILILGAWGCGAFNNPPEIVAEVFKQLCNEYYFDTIEFAIDCSRRQNNNYQIFKEVFEK